MKIQNLNFSYEDKEIFNNFNLEIKDNLITVILGESGAGKSTLLDIICGLKEYNGNVESKKDISMVFQKNRLVNSLTVKDNIKLVNSNADVDFLLKNVGLSCEGKFYIKNLSGGMARRVALARALAKQSELLLLDEPFINLDLKLKLSLIDLIKKYHYKNNNTVVMVTHDIKEAVLMADRIIVLKNGNITLTVDKVDKDTENVLFYELTK